MTHNDTSHVLFSFAYLTSHKEHNLDYFHKHPGGNEARSLIHLLDNLQFWSASTWNQLKELSHKERGYEEIGVDELRTNILDNLPVALSATDKVTSSVSENPDAWPASTRKSALFFMCWDLTSTSHCMITAADPLCTTRTESETGCLLPPEPSPDRYRKRRQTRLEAGPNCAARRPLSSSQP